MNPDLENDEELLDNSWEENKETPEKDNSQDGANGDKDEAKAKRHAEQLAGSKAEAERLEWLLIDSEVQKAKSDWKSLLDLHVKDPKVAEKVAKKFGYDSYKEAIATLDLDSWDDLKKKSWLSEDEFNKRYEEKRAEEEHNEALDVAEDSFNKLKDEDVRDKAIELFEELVGDRALTRKSVKKFVDMATLYASKDHLNGDILKWQLFMQVKTIWMEIF